jgi:predicted N-formylglutamate amidohydrolase
VPRVLGSLGLSEDDLCRHIAWDIGAAGLARRLASALSAWLIFQPYCRLVIDCNRPLTSPESIATRSEETVIPGNLAVSREQAALRAVHVFEPYHACIRRELDRRSAAGEAATLLFVHSFTPTFRGVARPWHAGILHHRDDRIAAPLLALLRRETSLVIGENEPYAADPLDDYGLIEHAERRGLPYVEIEVRQDLLADESGQDVWAGRLVRALSESASFRV